MGLTLFILLVISLDTFSGPRAAAGFAATGFAAAGFFGGFFGFFASSSGKRNA